MAETITTTSFSISSISGKGAKTKEIVAQMVTFGLGSIDSVDTDTTDEYVCWFRITGTSASDPIVKIYNSTSANWDLYIYTYLADKTTQAGGGSMYMVNGNKEATDIRLTLYNYGDFKHLCISATGTAGLSSHVNPCWLFAEQFDSSSDLVIVCTPTEAAFIGAAGACATGTEIWWGSNSLANIDISASEAVCVPVNLTNAGKFKGINSDYFYKCSKYPDTYWTKFYVGTTLMMHIGNGFCFKV